MNYPVHHKRKQSIVNLRVYGMVILIVVVLVVLASQGRTHHQEALECWIAVVSGLVRRRI